MVFVPSTPLWNYILPTFHGNLSFHHFIYFLKKFYFYFILLYNTVLVLPYIDMNPPWVYMRSQMFHHFKRLPETNFVTMLYNLIFFPYQPTPIYFPLHHPLHIYYSTIFNVVLKPCLVVQNIPDKFRFRHSFLFKLLAWYLGFLTIKWTRLMWGRETCGEQL